MIRAKRLGAEEAASVHNETLVAQAVFLLHFNILLHRESDSRLVEVTVLVIGRNWRTSSTCVQVGRLYHWRTQDEVLELTFHEGFGIREVHRGKVVTSIRHEVTDDVWREEPYAVLFWDVQQVKRLLCIQEIILGNCRGWSQHVLNLVD